MGKVIQKRPVACNSQEGFHMFGVIHVDFKAVAGVRAMNEQEREDEEAFEKFIVIADKLLQEGATDEDDEFEAPTDEVWQKDHYIHASMIYRALVNGILGADPWDDGSALPPNFEKVMEWIKFNIRHVLGQEEAIRVSLATIMKLLRQRSKEHRQFRDWGDRMNLEAVIRNSMLWLRSEIDRIEREKREADQEDEGSLDMGPDVDDKP